MWPTDASTNMTSSFCEYRPGHYHSALDIKTWNREGYKCFAVEDGTVEKIRVSPFGYGKVIYIRLADGNTAVYAHLQRFSKKIETQIRKLQLRKQKYTVTWYPKNLTVKKGQVIAYTGRTGIGVPHLHFEIRNKRGHPVNPLQFYDQVIDRIRPRLQQIALIPLTAGSRVNGSAEPFVADLTYIKNRLYIIKEPLLVKGRVGLAIRGYDQADGVFNKFAFYNTVMNVDGKRRFEITYDELDFSLTGFINTEIFYPLRALTKAVFHKLYIDRNNLLDFYPPLPTDGTLTMADKPLDFEIQVKDFRGNLSQVRGELLPDRRPEVKVNGWQKYGEWLLLRFTSSAYSSMQFESAPERGKWKTAGYFELLENEKQGDNYGLLAKIKLSDSTHSKLRISLGGAFQEKRRIVLNLAKKIQQDLSSQPMPEIKLRSNRLILQYDKIAENFYWRQNGEKHPLAFEWLEDEKSEAVIPASKLRDGRLFIGNERNADTLSIVNLLPGQPRSYSWFDSKLHLKSLVNSVYDTTLLAISRYNPDSLRQIHDVHGPVYRIDPSYALFWKGAQVRIKADSLPDWGNWALYSTNGMNSLSFVTSDYRDGYSFRMRKAGQYVVASDTIAPGIRIIKPRENASYTRNPEIKFAVSDSISGVVGGSELKISVDSVFVLPEWDPEEDLIEARIDTVLGSGQHLLEIQVHDAAGNSTRRQLTFKIK